MSYNAYTLTLGGGLGMTEKRFGSKLEYSERRGCSISAVHDLARSRRLIFTPDGRVDFAASDQRIEDTADPSRPSLPEMQAAALKGRERQVVPVTREEQDANSESYRVQRTKKAKFDAERARLEVEAMQARLIDAALVREFTQIMFNVFEGACRSLPARMGAALAATTDMDETTRIIGQVQCEVIADVRGELEGRMAG